MARFITLTEAQKAIARRLDLTENQLWGLLQLEELRKEEKLVQLTEVDKIAEKLGLAPQELRQLMAIEEDNNG